MTVNIAFFHGLRVCLAFIVVFGASRAAASFQFDVGDFYGSNGTDTIYEYNSSGMPNGSITLPYTGIRGLAFGPDGLLYFVVPAVGPTQAISVIAVNSAGAVQQTYNLSGFYVLNSTSFGKMSFGSHGQFFVGGNNGFASFTIGNPNSGTGVYGYAQGVFDIEPLTGGNMVAVDAYDVDQQTPSGTMLKKFSSANDSYLYDIRGVNYNPVNDTILVDELSYQGAHNALLALDPTTGNLLSEASLTSGGNILITPDGRIVAGSQSQPPEFFGPNLTPDGSFGGLVDPQFLTEDLPVPEPGTLSLLFVSAAFLLMRSRQIAA